MNNRVILLLGLLALGGLCGLCVRVHAPRMEQDLLSRSTAELRTNAIPAGGLSFSGRDALLTGAPGSPEVSDRALRLVASVSGVREVSVEYAGPPLEREPAIHPVQAKLDQALKGHPVEFLEDRVQLTSRGRAALDSIVPILAAAPTVVVDIQCRVVSLSSVSLSSGAAGDPVSKLRAQAVKTYLVSKGISPDRLIATGLAAAKPAAANQTPAGHPQDRRIEFVVRGGK
jgi:outer membrane protein OmpA-like peptidoglycan-associated protein